MYLLNFCISLISMYFRFLHCICIICIFADSATSLSDDGHYHLSFSRTTWYSRNRGTRTTSYFVPSRRAVKSAGGAQPNPHSAATWHENSIRRGLCATCVRVSVSDCQCVCISVDARNFLLFRRTRHITLVY